MIRIEKNVLLKPHNTFGFEVYAEEFCEVKTVEELREAILAAQNQDLVRVLGGGSNVLLTKNLTGRVIRIALKGIKIVNEDAQTLDVKVAAGENWDGFVEYAVNQNWGGLENLSLIPGSVGAAPVQNIGAYGVELKDILVSVQGLMRSGENYAEVQSLSNEECRFGYRNSIFKEELREKFVITSVTIRLRKNSTASDLETSYGAIQEEMQRLFFHTKAHEYTIAHVREAVCSIRRSKLPDPAIIGNAGSFFKNPEIPLEIYHQIKQTYSSIPSYPVNESTVKIPAAWLIEQSGWKGKRLNPTSDAAVHDRQALVLVNHGKATGAEILDLAMAVEDSVREKFGVKLVREVHVW